MIIPEIQTAGKNPHDDIEKLSFCILQEALVRTRRATLEPLGEKKENFDGFLFFYEENHQGLMESNAHGNPVFSRTPKYQLKGSATSSTSFDCEKKFLTRCFYDPDPVFLIFVDTTTKIIYYECISKFYITDRLKISDINTETRHQIRVNFDKIFSNDIEELINCYRVEEERLHNLNNYGVAEDKDIIDHKNSIRGLTGKDDLAIFDLEALLFFDFPVKASGKQIDNIRKKLKVTKTTLDYMVEKLETVGAVKKVGDLYTITNVPISQALLNNLIERKGVEYLYE